MKICDKLLLEHSETIDKVLDKLNKDNRAFISTISLSLLRHFVEHVMLKIYCEDKQIDRNNEQENIENAIAYISREAKYYFIKDFHKNHLQSSVSHTIKTEEYSETLMLLYFQPLLKIKNYLMNTYNFEVLKKIDKYPLDLDNTFLDYYKVIQKAVFSDDVLQKTEPGYYYVYKKKPIYVNKQLMYEVTLGPANDYADKLDRFVTFTKIDIFDNYSIEAFIKEVKIQYFDITVSIKVIDDYNVSIRTYELKNVGRIVNCPQTIRKNQNEFKMLMDIIKSRHLSLDKIASFDDESFDTFSEGFKVTCGDEIHILHIIEKAREIIINHKAGANVLKYLLCHLRNRTIRPQISKDPNPKISDLNLWNGALPFEETPYAANLLRSKQSLSHVFDCIYDDNYDCQLLARKIKEHSDKTGQLYINAESLSSTGDVDLLINNYNSLLPDFQNERRIEKYQNHLFIQENQTNTVRILRRLLKDTYYKISGYKQQAQNWIAQNEGNIKGEEKKSILENMFDKSRVFVLYGAAGTGKSTTISFVLKLLGNVKKICLAATHPAVQNMERKINDPNAKYITIKSFLSDSFIETNWDIVVIDECSVVSNDIMIKLLSKISYKALLLTGDIFQLPSIEFGNWFHIVKSILPSYAWFELKEQFRTNDNSLKQLWDKARSFDENIYEYLSNHSMTSVLNQSVFDNNSEDQIVLCYNYDGLYGINSINRYLQTKNNNKAFYWNQYTFKVGDPVLFHNTNRFNGLIHNNTKGKITKIEKVGSDITFEVAVDASLSSINFDTYDISYIGNADNGWTIIRFTVYHYNDNDTDDEPQEKHTIPFQVAYAVSIHKSQGLEYDYVKIIIANNVDELITHNVFYTAITRPKKKLMIYWTPETASKVISNFAQHFDSKDGSIIKNRFFSNNISC